MKLCVVAFRAVGPDWYMTTLVQWGGRLRYSPVLIHVLHADSAGTVEWTISVHIEKR